MQKLDMKTPNFTDINIEKLAALFPNILTETKDENGKLKKAIDFELLKQELSGEIVEGTKERYSINWAGKRESLLKANQPITKTLRPNKEESVDFDTTENLYIEGDNLEALKLLQESYLNKIKMIYIDPPYNTGKDFVYKDNFTQDRDEFLQEDGQKDEEGGRLVTNLDSNGRYHSDWLSMMYPRLKLARNLLKDDGVIFISIDDNEVHNLRKICDEIFGEGNFITIVSRVMKTGGNKGRYFSPNIDYVLVYAKDLSCTKEFRAKLSDELIRKVYTQVETEGIRKGEKYRTMGLYQAGLDIRANQRYWIQCPDGSFAIPNGKNFPCKIESGSKIKPTEEDGVWKWIFEKYTSELDNNNIIFKETTTSSLIDENGNQSKWNIYNKIWLNDRLRDGRVPVNLIDKMENRHSSAELKKLNIPFDFAKPTELIKYLIEIIKSENNDIILDFFSGSATLAHAVMQLNAEDGGDRKYICVQIPEKIDNEEFPTICEIGKERIRRAGKKILEDNKALKEPKDLSNLDIGFRVLKIDESNMKDVYFTPDKLTQNSLFDTVDNMKEERSAEDLLFGVMLDWGADLSSSIQTKTIQNKTIYFVNQNDLLACFDTGINEELIKELAKISKDEDIQRVVFRDKEFESDDLKDNIEQIFKQVSDGTEIRVI